MDLEIFADMMTAARSGMDILTDQPAETKLSAPKTLLGRTTGPDDHNLQRPLFGGESR